MEMKISQRATGRWGFVGRIDSRLAFIRKDGALPTEKDLEVAAHCGPGFANLQPRSWKTKEDAISAANALGLTVSSLKTTSDICPKSLDYL